LLLDNLRYNEEPIYGEKITVRAGRSTSQAKSFHPKHSRVGKNGIFMHSYLFHDFFDLYLLSVATTKHVTIAEALVLFLVRGRACVL
jgi:hypothetical protein